MVFSCFWERFAFQYMQPQRLKLRLPNSRERGLLLLASLAMQTLYFVSVIVSSHSMTSAGGWFPSLCCQLPFIFGCSTISTMCGTYNTCVQMIDGGNACLNILQSPLLPNSELIFPMQNSIQHDAYPRLNSSFCLFFLERNAKDFPGLPLGRITLSHSSFPNPYSKLNKLCLIFTQTLLKQQIMLFIKEDGLNYLNFNVKGNSIWVIEGWQEGT